MVPDAASRLPPSRPSSSFTASLLASPSEGTRGRWLRSLAAMTFLASGVIHLAQVALHPDEDLRFGLFFLVVGSLQVVAALALVRARRPRWYWLGIAGSGATIATWLVSRSVGLPFGAEPGSPESVGMADAAASLLEGITILALALWLGDCRGRTGPRAHLLAAAAIGAMASAWLLARRTGVLDPDVRLTNAPPELTDQAALVLAIASLVIFLVLARPPALSPGGVGAPVLRGLILVVLLSAGAATVLTLPARGGQNAACRYGPLAEVSGLTHAEPPDPVELAPGETRAVPVLLLSVCGAKPLMLTGAVPLNSSGDSTMLVGFRVRDPRSGGDGADGEILGVSTRGDGILLGTPSGALLPPGERREVVAVLRGTGRRVYRLDSVRLQLRGPSGDTTMAFATFLTACTGPCPAQNTPRVVPEPTTRAGA